MPVLLEGARWTVGSEQQSPPSLPQPSFGGQVIGPASVRSEPPQGSGAGPAFGKGVIGGSSSLATNTGFNQGSNPVKGQYPCVGQLGKFTYRPTFDIVYPGYSGSHSSEASKH